MPGNIKDDYGMPLSTNSTASADLLRDGLRRLLSQNGGTEEKLAEAIDQDDGFALAHGYMAYWKMQRARPQEARESIARALELSDGISRRERQQIEAVNLWITGKGPQSIALIKEHVAEFPRDALLLRLAHRLYMLGCSGAGVANFPPAYLALLQSIAPHCEDDWAFLAEYAFAHHETGQLDESLRLAERSLAINPTNAVGCHSATHVYFERGDAGGGEDFLGGWLDGFDAPPSSYVHLSWHLALFELALGKYQGVLDRYDNFIRPSVTGKSHAALNDSASLLWRMQIYGGTPPPMPWEEVCEIAAPAAERAGAGFRDGHAALAFAANGDQESLGKMTTRLRSEAEGGNLFAREVVLPLVLGIGAFAEGDYAESVRQLEPVFPQLTRVGGSHAQREVFEDTLLEAFLRAEEFDKAQAMLDSRLRLRETVRDTFWLGRLQAGRGQKEEAQASLSTAAAAWESGDQDSPEFVNLQHLAAAAD